MILSEVIEDDLSLKVLDPQTDDLTKYLSWMREPSRHPFIVSARSDYSLSELSTYLEGINQAPDAVQFAILKIHDGKPSHIGNIKFHELMISSRTAFVGFLIGDARWRGQGIANRAFKLGAGLLKQEFGIANYKLGVDSENTSAIRAYEKMGFQITGTNDAANFVMQFSQG